MRMLVAVLILFSAPAFALSVDKPLQDNAQEMRARALFNDLRCVVCQGESVADSPAEVARDMRMSVRAMVAEGKSDDEIVSLMVSQYGEKVLMMPTFSAHNALLWFLPVAILVFGAVMAWRKIFKGRLP